MLQEDDLSDPVAASENPSQSGLVPLFADRRSLVKLSEAASSAMQETKSLNQVDFMHIKYDFKDWQHHT